MFRIRLASVALALGLMCTASGCFFNEGPMFPRISSFFHRTNECECQTGQTAGHLPPEFAPPMPAPVLGHGAPPIPTITTVPATQPPQMLKGPAVTTPYFPPVN